MATSVVDTRGIRVNTFHEFEGQLPEELAHYCAMTYSSISFNSAAISIPKCSSDKERDVLRSNVKVFLPVNRQQDNDFITDITRIFIDQGFSVKRPYADRLICTAPVLGCKNYVTVDRDIDNNTPTIPTITTESVTSCFSSSSLMGQFGDRRQPVDQAEHDSNSADCELSIQKAETGICIGPYVGLCDPEALREHNITHAINASQRTSVVSRRLGIKVLDVDLSDTRTSDLLVHLPTCRAFICEAVNNGGTVLINCFAGVSRSASILIDYWMYRDKLTFRQARAKLRVIRTCIKPNAGFRKQLETYYVTTADATSTSRQKENRSRTLPLIEHPETLHEHTHTHHVKM